MGRLIYKTKVNAWGDDRSNTVTIVAHPEHKFSNMHNITIAEWELIEVILNAFANDPPPIPFILREVAEYIKEFGK